MKEEPFFDGDGFYQFIVESNVLLHRQAVDRGADAIRELLSRVSHKRLVRVLDLACGGAPISIAKMMEVLSATQFSYTGIDINPSAVRAAQERFCFPPNVTEVNLIEGDAWTLPSQISRLNFDVVFTGLNLHHGTPLELFVLFRRIRLLLDSEGVFINHDMYRPSSCAYVFRPDVNPNNPDESYQMISNDHPDFSEAPQLDFKGVAFCDVHRKDDWRIAFLSAFRDVLVERGADIAGICEAERHVYARDFCLSTSETREVLSRAGFEVQIMDYLNTDEPLRQYYATLVGRPSNRLS